MQLRRTHYSVTILYFRMRSPKAHDIYSCIAKIPTITQRQVQLWSWLKIAFISSSLGQTECQQAQNHGIIIIDNIEKIRKIIHTILTQLYLDMMEFPFHWHNFSSRYSSSTSKWLCTLAMSFSCRTYKQTLIFLCFRLALRYVNKYLSEMCTRTRSDSLSRRGIAAFRHSLKNKSNKYR